MANPLSPQDLQSLNDIVAAKSYYLAALTFLLYDYLLTLDLEIAIVWKKRKTLVLYLYLFVRYWSLISISLVSVLYFSPSVAGETCRKLVLFFPFGITMPLMILPALLMIIRVYAMYSKNNYLLAFLITYLLSQTAAGLWQYSPKGFSFAPAPVNSPYLHYCIYLPPKSLGSFASLYVLMELSFHTIICALTLSRAFYMQYRQNSVAKGGLIENITKNGSFYFIVIFCSALSWVVMILHAPTTLRAISSVPTSALTSVMICRINLNLRVAVYGSELDNDLSTSKRPAPTSIPLTYLKHNRQSVQPARNLSSRHDSASTIDGTGATLKAIDIVTTHYKDEELGFAQRLHLTGTP